MAFPENDLAVRVELKLGASWTDITSHVYTRDPITITRGRQDEGGQVDPSSCTMTLNNKDGRYSPRNPLSPHYGKLGRNTPIRVSVGVPVHLWIGTTSRARANDSAGLSITGDIDIRLDATAITWRAERMLAAKAASGSESWMWWIDSTGRLRWWSTSTGALSAGVKVASTVPVPVEAGRCAVRVTVDVDNGAAGNTVRFYTAPSAAGPWTQLGASVTTAGTTSIFDSAAPVEIGHCAYYSGTPALSGWYYSAEIRSGIGGSIRGNPDFTTATVGASTMSDGVITWTLQNTTIMDRDYRFHGEVSSWPQRWGPSGLDVHVPIEASGVMRRLGQGARPLRSAMHRVISATTPRLLGWWPLEDAQGSRVAASGYVGGAPARIFGAYEFTEEVAGGVSGGLTVGKGGWMTAPVPDTGALWRVGGVVTLPSDIGEATCPVLTWRTAGATRATDYNLYTNLIGQMFLEVSDGTTVLAYTTVGPDLRGRGPTLVKVEVDSTGGGSTFVTLQVDVQAIGMEITSDTTSRITSLGFNLGVATDIDWVGSWSHLMVANEATDDALTNVAFGAAHGYVGETAEWRMYRLAQEEGVSLGILGWYDATAMGAQMPRTLLEHLADAANADGGTLYEPRSDLGIWYRTRTSDYNTLPLAVLDYTAGQIGAPLEPVDDDQATRNDVTVSRVGGSSARYVVNAGPLSTAPPPDGVGRYDEEHTLLLASDDVLYQHAGWRAHLGTVDEPRFPVVRLKAHRHPDLIPAITFMDLRDRIRMTGLPIWVASGPVDVLVDGYTETIEPRRWLLELNCVPASAWTVAEVEHPVTGRAASSGSHLAAAATASATSLSVATTAGPRWTTDPADLPMSIEVGGEVMTVTAITGAASPQTFTVIRAVNGIVKSHSSAAPIRLATPPIIAL